MGSRSRKSSYEAPNLDRIGAISPFICWHSGMCSRKHNRHIRPVVGVQLMPLYRFWVALPCEQTRPLNQSGGHGYDPSHHTGNCYDTFVKRQAQDLRDMTSELREFTHEENAIMCQRYHHPPISPIAEMVWCGARQGMGSVMSCRAPLHLVMRSAAVQLKDNVNYPHAVL